jgi:hypothetical protein
LTSSNDCRVWVRVRVSVRVSSRRSRRSSLQTRPPLPLPHPATLPLPHPLPAIIGPVHRYILRLSALVFSTIHNHPNCQITKSTRSAQRRSADRMRDLCRAQLRKIQKPLIGSTRARARPEDGV